MASSALNIGNQLLNQMQEGAAIKPQLSFETPLMAVRSKSAVGHGDAMREQTAQQPAQQLAGIGERFKGMWLAFVDNVMDVVQQMHQKMKGTAESGF
ncbi:CG6290 [Drosophila busckii]|uniref:CG6290 n=1 Tax=Drosophila busckii TaxID=30019 RepID=A0A0M3QZU5_DROBS|nr:CG6290 [Drosophila busckii]